MNKQEAIGVIESISYYEKVNENPLEDLVNKIYDDLKPVVPKFVADFYESIKDNFEYNVYDLCVQFDSDNDELSSEVWEWFDRGKNEPIQTLVKMKLYGYEVETEKLYTVEIPNPNRASFTYTLYRKDDGKIIIIGAGDDYEKREEYQLTESEIKQDFDWAWQFAKEVENGN